MRNWFIAATCLLLAGCSSTTTPTTNVSDVTVQAPTEAPTPLAEQGKSKPTTCAPVNTTNVRAVRFDPSYYYGTGLSAAQLSEQLAAQWAANGVNTVYFMAYNPTYGARYQTTYANNVLEDWGRLDLLGAMLTATAKHNIRVVAWISDFRHGGAIAKNPAWTSLTKAGAPYGNDIDAKFMTLGSSSAESWYQGFIKDLLTRYPALEGVDIAEPVVNWWGDEADYSAAMTAGFQKAYPNEPLGGAAWRTYRAAMLTKHLQTTINTVRSFCKSVHVTMTVTADPNGNLLSSAALANETGFDLDGLLNGNVKPDIVNVELMWQQWKAAYGTDIFTPQWTATATSQALAAVAGRAKVVVHVETSQFGNVTPSPAELQASMNAAVQGGATGLDVYHTEQLDSGQAWPSVAAVYSALR